MKDDKIIKALEHCKGHHYSDCLCCPLDRKKNCIETLAKNTLDFINRLRAELRSEKAKQEIAAEVIERQQAEIEKLKDENLEWEAKWQERE